MKYELGFKPGVFDLFHYGHLRSIQDAAKQCKRLIVGVQDDRDVATYKGVRPTIPLQDRMYMIDALDASYVYQVISYRSPDLSQLLNTLKINALFVEDTYGSSNSLADLEQQATLDYCNDNSVAVVRQRRTHGVSTTYLRSCVAQHAILPPHGVWSNDHFEHNAAHFWSTRKGSTMLTSCNGDRIKQDKQSLEEAKLFGQYIREDDEVVDLGCGDGRLTNLLYAYSPWITGVDPYMSPAGHCSYIPVREDASVYSPPRPVDVVVMSGLLPCLDDEHLASILDNVRLMSPRTILLRTTVSLDRFRINVIDQFSNALNTLYTAFYRTEQEHLDLFDSIGYVLNHRATLYQNQPDTCVLFMQMEKKSD